jgi:hypothetical protein
MERIVLEVDDTVAKVWRSSSEEGKQQLNQTISMMIKKMSNDQTFADYSKLLDEVSSEAFKNGLTPEVLEALLANND